MTAGIAVVLLVGCGDTATADPTDVKAAQGCEASLQMLQHTANGTPAQVNADEAKLQPIASDLLKGTAEAQAAGKPEPKYSTLGAAFVSSMADDNSGDLTAFGKDTDIITAQCNKIPGIAKVAGGFSK